jgi:hypothetical protein
MIMMTFENYFPSPAALMLIGPNQGVVEGHNWGKARINTTTAKIATQRSWIRPNSFPPTSE